MVTKTLQDLFIHSLSDIYSAEKQMTKSLPKMARAATNPGLKTAFETHLQETQWQIERIDQVVVKPGKGLPVIPLSVGTQTTDRHAPRFDAYVQKPGPLSSC